MLMNEILGDFPRPGSAGETAPALLESRRGGTGHPCGVRSRRQPHTRRPNPRVEVSRGPLRREAQVCACRTDMADISAPLAVIAADVVSLGRAER